MEVVNKIVDYHMYCGRCEHFEKEGWEDPCHECLTTSARENSRQPLYFEERKNPKTFGSSRKKHGL